MDSVPAADGVMLTEQVDEEPATIKVHVPPGVNETVPVGTPVAAGSSSATVATQSVEWLTATVVGLQRTPIAVGCSLATGTTVNGTVTV